MKRLIIVGALLAIHSSVFAFDYAYTTKPKKEIFIPEYRGQHDDGSGVLVANKTRPVMVVVEPRPSRVVKEVRVVYVAKKDDGITQVSEPSDLKLCVEGDGECQPSKYFKVK